MDLFDPKPELTRRAGQPHPDGVEIHQPGNHNLLLPSPFEFHKYGQSGMNVSDALPHTATIVDDLCFVRSMHTEHNNHLEGLNMLLTCKIFPGRPVRAPGSAMLWELRIRGHRHTLCFVTPPDRRSGARRYGRMVFCRLSTRESSSA
jgi:hypothetical protein